MYADAFIQEPVLSVWKGIGSIQFTVQSYTFGYSVHRYRYLYM